MAGLARRLAPAAALGGLAVVIVGVADPALAGRTTSTDTGAEPVSVEAAAPAQAGTAAPDAPADASGTCSTKVTGDAAMTPWGPVQVVATTDGTRVCEVHAVTWPSGDGKSRMINSYAIPQLDAIASSGTQFDYVSGATYTSNAYAQSLQSILDAL